MSNRRPKCRFRLVTPIASSVAIRDIPARGADAGQWLGWVVAALVISLYAWTLARYAVNFPNADDFSQILAVPYYVGAKPTFWEKLALRLLVVGRAPDRHSSSGGTHPGGSSSEA